MATGTRRSWVLAVLAGLLVGGCLSPTLPLPPPSPPTVEEVGQGQYQLSGTIPQPGRVEALNLRTDAIAGQRTDRGYAFVIGAIPGDEVRLWYTSGTEVSESVSFIIAEDELRLQQQFDAGGSADGS